MEKRSAPLKVQRSVLVLEVCKTAMKDTALWTVFISIPGHPGMFTRTWQNDDGPRLGRSQMRDLVAWMNVTVENAILASGGIQQELFETQVNSRLDGDPRLA